MDMHSLVEQFQDEYNIHTLEGRRGVQGLATIVNVLGYKDPQYYGQFQGASLGDILMFLEDNSGAITAVIEWISKQRSPEWKEALQECLTAPQEPDADDEGDDDSE